MDYLIISNLGTKLSAFLNAVVLTEDGHSLNPLGLHATEQMYI